MSDEFFNSGLQGRKQVALLPLPYRWDTQPLYNLLLRYTSDITSTNITQAMLQLFESNQPQNICVGGKKMMMHDADDDEMTNAIPGCETK